jgi:hypothetical protein
MWSCNDAEAFDVNTLFGDSAGENLWLDLNWDTLPHDYFQNQWKNDIMASFDDVLEEVYKALEERKKAREEEMQELLACYTKDSCGSVT